MRALDTCWHWSGTAFTDVTTLAAAGGLALDVQGGHTLYMAHEDWISGALYMVTAGASDLKYTAERWNGESWERLPQQEAYAELTSGFDVLEQAADFAGHGVVDWGRAPGRWAVKVPTSAWPEAAVPPDTVGGRYWVRLRFTSGGPATLDRVLPLLYNTYATYTDLASFMGLPEFDEVHPPTAEAVRRILRRHEDWLDRYTRRSWRPRLVKHETHDFNPYGVGLRRRPVFFVTEVGLWNGASFEVMRVGRGEDVYLDPQTGMVYPLTPSYRLRYYSFLLSRFMRQKRSFRLSYVYGDDIDVSETGGAASDAVLRRAAADLTISGDWSSYLTSGLDVVPKSQRVEQWQREAEEIADRLRWTQVE